MCDESISGLSDPAVIRTLAGFVGQRHFPLWHRHKKLWQFIQKKSAHRLKRRAISVCWLLEICGTHDDFKNRTRH
jgi:hypothetical protein